MDRNKMKRKIAMMLCVCVLFASSAPLALAEAEDTSSEPQQVATLEENQPKQPVSREKIGMKLTPNNGVVSVALTGTAGEGVVVELFTETKNSVDKQKATFDANGNASVQLTAKESGNYVVRAQYANTTSNEWAQQEIALTVKAPDEGGETGGAGTETPETPVTLENPVTPVTPENPETPVTPENPETPVTPVTPENPETPVTPVTPENPETPVTPVTPENPETPVTPVTPENPETPVTPVTPENPVTPVTPENPVTPVTPENPVTPVTPENPVTPVTPENPVTPVTPENPVTPVTPENPENPVNPVTPITPETPATPATPTEEDKQFNVKLYDGNLKLDVEITGGSDKEVTVTLTHEDGTVTEQKKTLFSGAANVSFSGLKAGVYAVKVAYTGTSNTTPFSGSVTIYDENALPKPNENTYRKIVANASVNGQKIGVQVTDSGYNTYDAASGEMKVQPKTLVVTLIGGPSTKTIKTDTAFAEFTDLPAGQYTVTVAYDDHADAALESTINGLTVAQNTQAIIATASTDIGKISVDIYNAASDKELTVTLLDEKGSRVGRMTTTGKGILVFENLSAGKYTVTVNYTTPVEGVSEVKIGELAVYDKEHPEPLPTEQIEATATVSGQTIGISATKYAEGSTLKATLSTGKQITLNNGQGEFTNVPAGVYSVIVSYDGTDDGQCVIKDLKVETQSIAQAITATATAGVKRIDVDVTAASPMSVVATLMQNGQPKDTRSIAAGVGKVSFENLAAGTYSVSVNYAPAQTGVAATVIDNLNVTEENVKIAISGVTPGENKLTVSGTAKPNEPVMISTVPDGGSTIVNADANGKFSAELARTAGTYTEVSAQYVSDAASRVTLKGTFVVTGTVTKPGLEVDDLYNNSLTVVAKTTAGVTVYLKTGDYEQTLVADNRGIVRFTLPHTYAQGTRFTLTVYYGAGNSMSYNVEATVGGTPYYKLFKRGSRGDGVYALTSRLSEMGYPVSPTNYYSDSVAAAVRLFQSANGLSADGMAGKLTQEKLYSVSAIGYSESGQTYPTLVRGDRGMALLYTLQQRLKDLGYYTIRVDGIFGSGTQRAVRWFQSVNGLSVTGKADNATQQLLYSAQAKAASGYSPDSYDTLSRSNRYKAAVVPLQRRLKALGYLSGSADGYFGSNTYRAVRNFQSRNGLSVTGVADSGTQQLLYSSSARPASGSSSSGSGSSTGYRLLYWGCRGDAVKRLQQALIDAGYKSYVRSADGIYGQWTYDAVRAYQKDVGLSVDGIAGRNTQNKLYGTKY